MSEADDHFLALDACPDVTLGLVRGVVALLNLKGDLIGAAVLRAAQRANGSGDARMHIRAGARNDSRGKRRGIELVLGVQNQRGVHRADPGRIGCASMQQVQEMSSDRVVFGLYVNALAVE